MTLNQLPPPVGRLVLGPAVQAPVVTALATLVLLRWRRSTYVRWRELLLMAAYLPCLLFAAELGEQGWAGCCMRAAACRCPPLLLRLQCMPAVRCCL